MKTWPIHSFELGGFKQGAKKVTTGITGLQQASIQNSNIDF